MEIKLKVNGNSEEEISGQLMNVIKSNEIQCTIFGKRNVGRVAKDRNVR